VRRGDVYDVRLDPIEGSEQGGVRPVIIVSRNAINQNSSVMIIIPVTSATNIKRQYPHNVSIEAGEGGLNVASVALGGQIRAISRSRLLRQRGTLSPQTMQAIDRALRITLNL
jgi:mRNA interferase MazF